MICGSSQNSPLQHGTGTHALVTWSHGLALQVPNIYTSFFPAIRSPSDSRWGGFALPSRLTHPSVFVAFGCLSLMLPLSGANFLYTEFVQISCL